MEAIAPKECFGCGICAGICPVEDAIEMQINKYGFYKPVIDGSKCHDCGLCIDVCPAIYRPEMDGNKNDDVFGEYVNIYGGWVKNNQLRSEASAGGIARKLAHDLLSKRKIDGVLTVAPNKHNLLEPQPRLYTEKKDLRNMAKSLYLPTEYSQVVKYLSRHSGRYLVIGLPCQVAGLRKAEKNLKAKVILVDLFCGRMVSRLLTEGYIRLFTGEKLENLSIDYRDKTTGWYDFSISVENQLNNKVITREGFNKSVFGFLMNRRYFAQDSCLDCSYSYSGVSDITLGDFWESKYSEERKGVSLIVTRTECGDKILRICQDLSLFEVGILDVYSAQSHLVRNYKHSQSKLFSLLKGKQRLINKVATNLFLFSRNLKIVYWLYKVDSGIYGLVVKSLQLIKRFLRKK